MLLSLKHNFLFVHIAKTGGTSVRAALSRYRYRGRHGLPLFLADKLDQMTGHRIGAKFPRHAKAIAAREMLPAEVYDRLFKFVFVRNPWDLQVSSYFHIRRERPRVLEGVADFEAFMRLKFDPDRPWNYLLDTALELQRDYVVDLHGRTIVDFIGHYESLQADFDQVCRRIGLPGIPLPHRRRAEGRDDYRRYYSDETAALVAEHYRPDIELFGYRFDPPQNPEGGDLTPSAPGARSGP
ncbi:sulfotransferase family 2 domain-containing protein [Ectothiorhodospira mobilis]|uniref:sulfotransferase family 2 domain-containing protein n=1 Tax=Ectothiorhodospira mobilis TaxID=195064 RepID=UPI0019087D5E|nr:sulfotransferase family 2 domain-containing protein [Ectothiorhodospira mobilis]MBK1691833.1 sulfotransferase [Ectothiorhodospira mobilis]